MPTARQWTVLLGIAVALLAIMAGAEKFFGIPLRVAQLEKSVQRIDDLANRMSAIELKLAASSEWQQQMLSSVTRMSAMVDTIRGDVAGIVTRQNRTDDKLENYQVNMDNELARMREQQSMLHNTQKSRPQQQGTP